VRQRTPDRLFHADAAGPYLARQKREGIVRLLVAHPENQGQAAALGRAFIA
jgi:hypothetical protein